MTWRDPAEAWRRHLERASDEVRGLAKGGRGLGLYRHAYTVGGALGWPGASREEAERELIAAAGAVGLRADAARGHVRRGLAAGARSPLELRTAPAPRGMPPRPRLPVTPTPPEPPRRLPVREVLSLWYRLAKVGDDPAAAAWVRSRGLDPAAIDAAQLARALPPGLDLPGWADGWPRTGYRLILPVWDADGVQAGVRARGIPAPPDRTKTLAPQGQGSAGLLLADTAGRAMLCGGRRELRRVCIVEGETDFLTLATVDPRALLLRGQLAPRRLDDGVAVLGVYAGAWPAGAIGAALAARVPDGARVVVATDPDDAGERYCQTVADTLIARGLDVMRYKAPAGDLTDHAAALRLAHTRGTDGA